MQTIKIITKTNNGVVALLKDRKDMKLRERAILATMYTMKDEKVDEQYTRTISMKNSQLNQLLDISALKKTIVHSMQQNGATIDIDYIIVIE